MSETRSVKALSDHIVEPLRALCAILGRDRRQTFSADRNCLENLEVVEDDFPAPVGYVAVARDNLSGMQAAVV
jgi:hypothetical protein